MGNHRFRIRIVTGSLVCMLPNSLMAQSTGPEINSRVSAANVETTTQSLISNALSVKNNPPELAFLNGLAPLLDVGSPVLAKAIAKDIDQLSQADAAKSILNRFRLEGISRGFLPQQRLVNSGIVEKSVLTAAPLAVGENFRARARATDSLDIGSVSKSISDEEAKLMGRMIAASNSTMQVGVGQDVARNIQEISPQISQPGTDTVNLKYCGKPFEELDKNYKLNKDLKCSQGQNNMRCEEFDSRQFVETVRIQTVADKKEVCTGVYIGKNWILSAAHCLFKNQDGSKIGKPSGQFPNFREILNADIQAYAVEFANKPVLNSYSISRGYIHKDYISYEQSKTNQGTADIAIFKLDETRPVPNEIVPATLSRTTNLSSAVTFAGYGKSERGGGGTYNDFQVTWPQSLLSNDTSSQGLLSLLQPSQSNFCSGDSGGPAFRGYQRGCTGQNPDSPYREVVGIVAFHAGKIINGIDDCKTAPISSLTSVAFYRQSICQVTENQARGC